MVSLTGLSSILDYISYMQDAIPAGRSPDINVRIAEQVRTLRAALGLSLETLASRSDVSRSMLSLIERGESSPTAVTLEKVATGLGVSLATLFEDRSRAPSPGIAPR